MSFDLKRKQSLEVMARTGVSRSSYEPLAFRVLWRIGIAVPPPHFAPFLPIVLSIGMVFGVVWGALMWVILWAHIGIEWQRAFMTSGLAGLLFGSLMGLYYAYGRYKYKLPEWNSLGD